MVLPLKDTLRYLCVDNGWSYAIIWRVKSPDSMLLMSKDSYCEDRISTLVEKILHQVHLVGEGIIGKVAFTAKDRWIFSDAYCGESSPTGSFENHAGFQDTAEWQHQFSSGIKTIAVISVLPQTVVQFGSTQMILERSDFVHRTRSLFQQLQNAFGNFLYERPHKAFNCETYDPFATYASVLPSSISGSNHGNFKFMDGKSYKDFNGKTQYLTNPSQPSSPAVGLPCSSLQSNGLAISAVPVSAHATKDADELFQTMSRFTSNCSFPLMAQCQKSVVDSEVLLSTPSVGVADVIFQSNSSSSSISAISNAQKNMCNSDISSLTSLEQGLMCGLGVQRTPSVLPTHLEILDPCGNMISTSHGISISSLLSNMEKTLDTSPGCEAGRTADDRRTSSFHVGEGSPFRPQHPTKSADLNTFLDDFGPPAAPFHHIKPNAVQTFSSAPPLKQENNGKTSTMNENLLKALGVLGTDFLGGEVSSGTIVDDVLHCVQNSEDCMTDSLRVVSGGKDNFVDMCMQLPADNDLFDSLGLSASQNQGQQCWDNTLEPLETANSFNLSTGISECISELDTGYTNGMKKGFYPEIGCEHLLDAIVSNVNVAANLNSDDRLSSTTVSQCGGSSVYGDQVPLAGFPCRSGSMDTVLPQCNSQKDSSVSQREVLAKSLVRSSIEDSYNLSSESAGVSQRNRSEEPAKVTKKRARPGESTLPRPKDRQQIQDRVKELRKIIPNGAKCSIDALLDRTIKHMFFLQSVTKYADKLKQIDEPMIIGEENAVVLEDNSSGNGGGATWAFEVGGETMVCPILVEDLGSTGQMLVEMLCEERGSFLEIADMIHGFGLTILKGVMEVRDDKFWVRFVLEATRDITRMDIFLSLVQLLQQTSGISSGTQPNKATGSNTPVFTNYQQF